MEFSKDRSTSPTLLGVARALVVSTRPKQWTKNLLIYFALFFTASNTWELDDISKAASLVGETTLAFVLFSGLSGAVYLVNDILYTLVNHRISGHGDQDITRQNSCLLRRRSGEGEQHDLAVLLNNPRSDAQIAGFYSFGQALLC